MKNNQKRIRLSKKSVLILVFGIAILLGGWLAFTNFAPRPLGDGLEYLGKKDFGDYLFGDSKPHSKYYYGTDVDIEEIRSHFPKAKLKSTDSYAYSAAYRTRFIVFSFNDQVFTISYYNSNKAIAEAMNIKETDKKYTISITSYDYEAAKKAL
ncbi:MAG TPA: hypothetical protein VFZ58_00480 [Candidatus Saccharimonadales bacterium]